MMQTHSTQPPSTQPFYPVEPTTLDETDTETVYAFGHLFVRRGGKWLLVETTWP